MINHRVDCNEQTVWDLTGTTRFGGFILNGRHSQVIPSLLRAKSAHAIACVGGVSGLFDQGVYPGVLCKAIRELGYHTWAKIIERLRTQSGRS